MPKWSLEGADFVKSITLVGYVANHDIKKFSFFQQKAYRQGGSRGSVGRASMSAPANLEKVVEEVSWIDI